MRKVVKLEPDSTTRLRRDHGVWVFHAGSVISAKAALKAIRVTRQRRDWRNLWPCSSDR